MSPEHEPLTMYGRPSEVAPLAWSWVEAELVAAGAYWVTARGAGNPHPRPVWGVWSEGQLHLSIGSPGQPNLEWVIVSYADQVVMCHGLGESIEALFGVQVAGLQRTDDRPE